MHFTAFWLHRFIPEVSTTSQSQTAQHPWTSNEQALVPCQDAHSSKMQDVKGKLMKHEPVKFLQRRALRNTAQTMFRWFQVEDGRSMLEIGWDWLFLARTPSSGPYIPHSHMPPNDKTQIYQVDRRMKSTSEVRCINAALYDSYLDYLERIRPMYKTLGPLWSSLVGIGICEGLLWNCWSRKGMRDWMLAALAIQLCLPPSTTHMTSLGARTSKGTDTSACTESWGSCHCSHDLFLQKRCSCKML